MRLRSLALLVLPSLTPACASKETAARSTTAPSASAAQPAVVAIPIPTASADTSTSPANVPPPPASAPCAEAEWPKPTDAEDVAWAKRLADEMGKGMSRKKLACLFGPPSEANADFLKLRPRTSNFKDVQILAKWFDFPSEQLEVTFADGARPLVTSVERATVPTKETFGHHPGTPRSRIGYFTSPKDVELRIIITLAQDDPTRVERLHLDVSDLRSWKPKPVRCWDELSMSVYPLKDRFEPGTWTFTATAPGALAQTFTCKVPVDILDRGTCTPEKDGPSSAELGSNATAIRLHIDGQSKTVALEARHEGKVVKTRAFQPKYSTVTAPTTPSGTCTYATESFILRAP